MNNKLVIKFLLFTTFAMAFVQASDPANVPPSDGPCAPTLEVRSRRTTMNELRFIEETKRTHCADGSLNKSWGLFGEYPIFVQEERTTYSGGDSCPADTDWVEVDRRTSETEVGQVERLTADNGCDGGGDEDEEEEEEDDDGEGNNGGGDCDGDGIPNSLDSSPGCGLGDNNGGYCYELFSSESNRSQQGTAVFSFYTVPILDEVTIADQDLPSENGLNILYERIGQWIPRRGFRQLDNLFPSDPEQLLTYKKKTERRLLESGCIDEGNPSGTTTFAYDFSTFGFSRAYSGYTHYWLLSGTVESEVTASATSKFRIVSYGYDGEEPFKIRFSEDLSDPYTTADFRQDAASYLPAFSGEFPSATTNPRVITAAFEFDADTLGGQSIYYQKVRFKFKWGSNVTPEEKGPVTYLVIFVPEDDLTTTEVDESENVEVVEAINWNGTSNTAYTIIPDHSKDGDYRLINVEIAKECSSSQTITSVEKVVVGQKVSLALNIPDPLLVTSYSWSVPGRAIKNYQDSSDIGRIIELEPEDLDDQIVGFYWWNGENQHSGEVTCNFTLNGHSQVFQAKTKFDVLVPQSTLIATDNGSIGIQSYGGAPHLGYGNSLLPSTAGVKFEKTLEEPDGFSEGVSEFWQLLDATLYSGTLFFNPPQTSSVTCSNDFDGAKPYFETIPNVAYDSPALPLQGFDEAEVTVQQLTMYLMYKPSKDFCGGNDTIWVPLRSASWGWSASADRNATTGNWSVLSSNKNVFSSISPDDTNWFEPVWSGNADDCDF